MDSKIIYKWFRELQGKIEGLSFEKACELLNTHYIDEDENRFADFDYENLTCTIRNNNGRAVLSNRVELYSDDGVWLENLILPDASCAKYNPENEEECPYCGSKNFEWMGDAFGDEKTPYHCHHCDSWF